MKKNQIKPFLPKITLSLIEFTTHDSDGTKQAFLGHIFTSKWQKVSKKQTTLFFRLGDKMTNFPALLEALESIMWKPLPGMPGKSSAYIEFVDIIEHKWT